MCNCAMYVRRLGIVLTISLAVMAGLTCSGWTDTLPDKFANISPMSGGGFAVDPSGNVNGFGAFQINIPVAYIPKPGYLTASGYVGGVPSNKDNQSFEHKTGILGGTVGSFPRTWLSVVQSGKKSTLFNAQLAVVDEEAGKPAISVGFQSITQHSDTPRWGFLVISKRFEVSGGTFMTTVGIRGNTGQQKPIGGISIPVSPNFNFATEWDGYQLNTAMICRPQGRDGIATLLGGYNGHAGWLAGLNFTFRVMD